MIRIFNSTVPGEREIPLDEVNIVTQKIGLYGEPYILFEHPDFPLGALKAEYNGTFWSCDLD
jgi:hypothetical protein|tara:strand:- start:702 stop:887 length:186 start_codon:yes stop_codon:yes gene_type:complete